MVSSRVSVTYSYLASPLIVTVTLSPKSKFDTLIGSATNPPFGKVRELDPTFSAKGGSERTKSLFERAFCPARTISIDAEVAL